MKLQSTCSCGAGIELEDSGTGYTIRDTFSTWQLRHNDCKRSHPHENMDAMCELKTEIARLTNLIPDATKMVGKRQWVGLTEEDYVCVNQLCETPVQAAEYVNNLLKEKNT